MDEHYLMNVLKAVGLKIDTLEFMIEEYKRTITTLEEENAKLRKELHAHFAKPTAEAMPNG